MEERRRHMPHFHPPLGAPLQKLDILRAQVPGLHVGLALASALASYVNFLLLWHWLRKAGVYQRQPGWSRHWLRLGLSCLAMAALIALFLLRNWDRPPVSGSPNAG